MTQFRDLPVEFNGGMSRRQATGIKVTYPVARLRRPVPRSLEEVRNHATGASERPRNRIGEYTWSC